ncbi:MAG: carbamoyltransferase N-terminal domain-containing protein, partial [Nitrospinales bacterium]
MIILGITHPISWSTGACLLVDGRLIAMVEEERLNRIKFSPRMFPQGAIDFCLKKGEITLNEVDFVAVGFDRVLKTVLPNFTGQPLYYGILAAGYMALHTTSNLRKIPLEIKKKKPVFINHHVSHANSAFYCSDFEESNIISLDGTGGDNAGLIGYAKDTQLEIFHTISNSDSWGNMYAQITRLLGFKPHQDEYKVMGLASYGTADPKGLPFIDWDRPIPTIDRTKYRKYRRWLKEIIDTGDPMNQTSQDIAATAQETLERVALRMLEWLRKK